MGGKVEEKRALGRGNNECKRSETEAWLVHLMSNKEVAVGSERAKEENRSCIAFSLYVVI